MTAFALTPGPTKFGARLETDDLLAVAKSDDGLAAIRDALDRYMVLHVSAQDPICCEAMGRIALGLGMPPEMPANSLRGRPQLSADYPFIGNFSSPARDPSKPPRAQPYIDTLHYDGVSAYSMQATFDTDPLAPNLWCDMRAAYAGLPDELRRVVDRSSALHAVVPGPSTPLAQFPDFEPDKAVRQPLRIRHPRTGEPLLFLPKNPASLIDGLPQDEGRAILRDLWDRVCKSEVRYSARAVDNQLFIWDGLGTTHTNPPHPDDRPLTLWFLVIPGAKFEVDPYDGHV